MKDITLLILAAGMGSRFGGLKQIEPVGPNQEFIIDYSIYDAVKAGFTKVVFVIKKENDEVFRSTIGARISNSIRVEYAYQELDDLPRGYELPVDRVKPWGTGHAILAARDLINGPFMIINADDFYGYEGFKLAYDHLTSSNDYCLIGYKLFNTLSSNGTVKRGVVSSTDNYLDYLVESDCYLKDDKIAVEPLDGSESLLVEKDKLCSMNMMGYHSNLFRYTQDMFKDFLNNNINDMKSEFLIPNVITQGIKDEFCKMLVIPTNEVWLGMTYREDLDFVKSKIKEYHDNGIYPKELWK